MMQTYRGSRNEAVNDSQTIVNDNFKGEKQNYLHSQKPY